MTVYIDELLAVNFILDYALLRAAARIAGRRTNRSRFLLAAACGALYALVCCLPGMDFLSSLPLRLLAGGGICSAAFGVRRESLRAYGWFFVLGAALAGGVGTLARFGGDRAEVVFGTVYVRMPLWLLLTSSGAVWAVLTLVTRIPGLARSVKREKRHSVIFCGENRAEVDVLTDTGCLLRDPADNSRVIVVGRETAEKLLPGHIGAAVKMGLPPEEIVALKGGPAMRLIGASGVSGDGLLLCFTASEVILGGVPQGPTAVAVSPNLDGEAAEALIGV